jgi:hypothetical protein
MADPTRVNLARFHATRLSLSTRSEVDIPSFNQMLSDYGVKDSRGASLAVFYTRYSRSNVTHSCLGTVAQVKPSTQEYEFDLVYSTTLPLMPFRPPKGTRPVNEMLDTSADIPVEQSFSCRAHFEYPRERYTDIIGMRLRKVQEGATLYDAIIDHGASEDIVGHAISFVYVAEFALDLALRVLEEARDISLKFGQVYE